ncbi:MAG: hypothetical protein AAF567_07045 [Actinomycetota bacterium]
MAERSELSHRLLELKSSMMGRLAPRILSRKTTGVDGLAKKLAAKAAPETDDTIDPELLHPDDVPEIVSGHGVDAADEAGR